MEPKNWKNRARTAGRIMLFCFFALNPLAGWFYLNRIPKRDRKPGIDDNRLDAYRSIAVLPFARGSDTDSDGLTREIPRLTIEKLEETRAFFVSRWEETEFFDDPLAAGEALDVDTALMGEVSEWNETISVRVRLVKVKGEDARFTIVDWQLDLKARLDCQSADELAAAAARGINPERYKRSTNYQTGVGALHAERGLAEYRIRNHPIFARAEEEYYKMVCLVCAAHGMDTEEWFPVSPGLHRDQNRLGPACIRAVNSSCHLADAGSPDEHGNGQVYPKLLVDQ